MTTTEQRLAAALRDVLPYALTRVEDMHADGGDDSLAWIAANARYTRALATLQAYDQRDLRSPQGIAAYDAQQAQAVADGAWVAEPITNVVSAPPLPRRAYREPVANCNSAEYAERITACVNACAGMTTAEVLEFGAPGELGRCAQAWVAEDNDNA